MNRPPAMPADAANADRTAHAPRQLPKHGREYAAFFPRYRTRIFASWLLCMSAAVGWSTAVYAANCTVSATAVTFGNYDPLAAAPLNGNGDITVTCNGRGTFTVALSTGQSGSYAPRYMTGGSGGGDRLGYNLYTDAAHTIVFGDGTEGTETESKNFKNNTSHLTVHGQIPAMENIAAGNYSDTILVTVTF